MADANKNNQVDPDEAEDTVKEEETVSDAFQDDKITKEEAEQVDNLDALGKEAEKIKMEEEMGKASQTADIQPADIQATPIPVVEIPKQEEKPAVAVSTPAEVVKEVVREQASEVMAKATAEPKAEAMQEIKKI